LSTNSLVILIAFNALAYWQYDERTLFIIAAGVDMIFGAVMGAAATIPSVEFFEAIGIFILGAYYFIDKFVMSWFR